MNNEKRCKGCGIVLQDENILQEGYIGLYKAVKSFNKKILYE